MYAHRHSYIHNFIVTDLDNEVMNYISVYCHMGKVKKHGHHRTNVTLLNKNKSCHVVVILKVLSTPDLKKKKLFSWPYKDFLRVAHAALQ
jgi:hypothetical protein